MKRAKSLPRFWEAISKNTPQTYYSFPGSFLFRIKFRSKRIYELPDINDKLQDSVSMLVVFLTPRIFKQTKRCLPEVLDSWDGGGYNGNGKNTYPSHIVWSQLWLLHGDFWVNLEYRVFEPEKGASQGMFEGGKCPKSKTWNKGKERIMKWHIKAEDMFSLWGRGGEPSAIKPFKVHEIISSGPTNIIAGGT